MKYIVAIPSYKRSEILRDQTLQVLLNGGVSLSSIYVFVANDKEKEVYEMTLPKKIKIIVGVPGIVAQRTFIRNFFKFGKKIVSIDDDVKDVFILGKDSKLIPMPHLDMFFQDAFKKLKEQGLNLWGVYPTPNVFYMSRQQPVTTRLKFVIGTLYGFINTHEFEYGPLKEKEDYETSLQYFLRDGGILRFNWVCFKTRFKNPIGGLGAGEERNLANKKAADYLVKTYPQYVRYNKKKENEILFTRKN